MNVPLTSFILLDYCIKLSMVSELCPHVKLLYYMIDFWLEAIDNNQMLGVVLMDFIQTK